MITASVMKELKELTKKLHKFRDVQLFFSTGEYSNHEKLQVTNVSIGTTILFIFYQKKIPNVSKTFTAEGISETGPFMCLSNHVFQSQ